MKRFLEKKLWLTAAAAGALLFCAWIFGWGGGPINVMDFSADDVDRVELSCSHSRIANGRAVVTGKEDIQTIIGAVNAFRHTGNNLKYFLRYGFSAVGSVLYEIDVCFTDGERFSLRLCPEAHSDTELYYWVWRPEQTNRISRICSGSLEWFYELHGKYMAAPR